MNDFQINADRDLNEAQTNSPLPTKRILFIVNDITYFFSHRVIIARAAAKAGLQVHVAAYNAIEMADLLRKEGMTPHQIAIPRGISLNPFKEIAGGISTFALYRQIAPDIIHAVTLKPALVAGFVARLRGGPAAVLAINGLGYTFVGDSIQARLLRFIARPALKYVLRYNQARTIVQNPDDLDVLRRIAGISDHRISLIKGSGVDCSRFEVIEEPPEPVLVVLASRMLWDKGIGDFVEAARILHKRGVAARFALVGKPDPSNPRGVPAEQLRSWSDDGHIEYWGYRGGMETVLSSAHIVCLPSFYREGVPKVLIEAAACGRPIVTTDTAGCREIGRDGENAILVPPRDPARLADALERLILDRELRVKMGKRGREIVLSEFSDSHVVAKTLDLYRNLLGAQFPRAA